MRATPPAELALCRRLRLVRPTCPLRVPVGRYAHARRPPGFHSAGTRGAIAICANTQKAGVALTSSACQLETWILEAGAPAGLPPDAPRNLPGKRLGPRRTRPPQYVHITIYGTRGNLEAMFPFAWPPTHSQRVTDRLLRADRAPPVGLGRRRWGGHNGTLILAPPLVFGGENGDHLIFRWNAGGIDRVVSLHSWSPLREAIATLRSIIVSSTVS